MIQRGVFYGVGTGPGDPELMTLKAVRILKQAEVIAAPGKIVEETTAFRIAARSVPGLSEKELLPVSMPMVTDPEILEQARREGAERIEEILSSGRDVAFVTLGDPTVYSTCSYLEQRIRADGFETQYVSGIPSFCAAAAALRTPLAEWQEPLHIIPAFHIRKEEMLYPGNCVLMKSGRRLGEVKASLKEQGREAMMVENCGMEGERIFRSLQEMPEESGYFALILSKEKK